MKRMDGRVLEEKFISDLIMIIKQSKLISDFIYSIDN